MLINRTLLILLFVSVSFFSFGQNSDSRKWQIQITPNIYLPTLKASLNFKLRNENVHQIGVKIKPTDYFDKLKMAFMINVEAKKNNWLIFGDFFYYRLAKQNAYINSVTFEGDNPGIILPPISVDIGLDAGSHISFSSTQYTLVGGYGIIDDRATLDVIGGLRMVRTYTTLDWYLNAAIESPIGDVELNPTGNGSYTLSSWNGIIGIKGKVPLTSKEKLQLLYYLDMGLGTANFTWQAVTGLGYKMGTQFRINLSYRHINYKHNEKHGISKLAYSGLAMGVSINF